MAALNSGWRRAPLMKTFRMGSGGREESGSLAHPLFAAICANPNQAGLGRPARVWGWPSPVFRHVEFGVYSHRLGSGGGGKGSDGGRVEMKKCMDADAES